MSRKKPAADPDDLPRKPQEVTRTLAARRTRERELRARKARGEALAADDAAFLAKADEEIATAAHAIAMTPPKSAELVRAESLLERILIAFGHHGRRAWTDLMKDFSRSGARRMTLARGELADDAQAYEDLRREELVKLLAFLEAHLSRMDDLRARLWKPGSDEYARRWTELVGEWNRRARPAETIPTLCEVCGDPIFARELDADGMPPTVCSEEHRLVVAQRRARERAKKRSRTP